MVERMTAHELAALLKDPTEKDHVCVIDCRDDDFHGGNIRGAINVPEDNFHDNDDVEKHASLHFRASGYMFPQRMRSQQ